MLIVDTQADNQPAINFFKKHGFSNPKKHLYMALNLDEANEESR
jgi:ribosomal protein S18 acetylase RimI-like enzyme